MIPHSLDGKQYVPVINPHVPDQRECGRDWITSPNAPGQVKFHLTSSNEKRNPRISMRVWPGLDYFAEHAWARRMISPHHTSSNEKKETHGSTRVWPGLDYNELTLSDDEGVASRTLTHVVRRQNVAGVW